MRGLPAKYRLFWLSTLLIGLVTTAYLPTFHGGFILDDRPLIERNEYLRKPHSLTSYLGQEDGVIDKEGGAVHHTGYYRPLVTLTYRLDYLLWGMNAQGFRTTNLVLHVATCLLLFGLLVYLTGSPVPAFWVVLLFSLHPVNTEAVSWIASRNNILATLFMILSLWCYMLSWARRRFLFVIVSLGAFVCALFSKEFGVMTLPIFFLYHRFLTQEKRNRVKECLSYLPFVLILLIYFFLRKSVIGAFVSPFGAQDLAVRIFFVPYLVFLNLKLVFLPHGLHYLYVQYPESPSYPPALICILLFISAGAFLWRIRARGPVVFSAIAFFLCLLPVLNIVPSASTTVTLLALRWLYLPMAFLCPGAAFLLKRGLQATRGHMIFALVTVASVYLGVYTFVLNQGLWREDHTFFEQEVKQFGNFFLAGDLAETYFRRGDYRQAERYFRIAVDKYPRRLDTLINYSAFLVETRRPAQALALLRRAAPLLKTRQERGRWHGNKGIALQRMGRRKEALVHFRKAVLYLPRQAKSWSNLGGALGELRLYKESEKVLMRGLLLDPDSIDLRMNLARTYIGMNESDRALAILKGIPHNVLKKAPALMKWKVRAERKKKSLPGFSPGDSRAAERGQKGNRK
ncbi:MAG: tetratricopeptide repeat protein [Deltaproteobacteria bacterium]|nr:tetratricopeptide repeat protein [Deltaproteobacteria bacterium]MBW2102812.1 tetratricopeptide repeat protein [Deltaproteobacteria bacterium]MBW2347536.1 tetratricopeptide repeat protein [Deltaproteobacteria bacterium]